MKRAIFGMAQGQPVYSFTLTNQNGMAVELLSLGARVRKLIAPDANGNRQDVVLGYDELDAYQRDPYYFGATIGRVCGRIAGAGFCLENTRHTLSANEGGNHLHGGLKGFDKQLFQGSWSGNDGVTFRRTSPANEEGYPGDLEAYITYRLLEDNALYIEFKASAKSLATVACMTHHSYFNLAGHDAGHILDHQLSIDADFYTPIDDIMLPTGEILRVENTALDFRAPKRIGQDIAAHDANMPVCRGYDHNFVCNTGSTNLRRVAKLFDPTSGRRMTVETDYPGLQFYTANWVDTRGKEQARYAPHSAVCLEPQFFPDALNQPHFESPVVGAWEMCRKTVIYRFDWQPRGQKA